MFIDIQSKAHADILLPTTGILLALRSGQRESTLQSPERAMAHPVQVCTVALIIHVILRTRHMAACGTEAITAAGA